MVKIAEMTKRVWYFTVERFVLAVSDQGLKFIRVVNHSAMNNIKIIDAKTRYAKVLLYAVYTADHSGQSILPIIVGNGNKPLYCNVPDSLSDSLVRARL